MIGGAWNNSALSSLVADTIGGLWGSPPDSTKPDETDVLVIRGADFRDWNSQRALNAAQRRIPARSLERRQLKAGDLVLEVSGGSPAQPVGRVIVIDERAVSGSPRPLICSNFCRKVRLKQGVDPFFVKRQLDWRYHSGHMDHFQTSTTNIRNLQVDDFLRGTEMMLPKRDVQTSLSALLDTIEDRRLSGSGHLDACRRAVERFRRSVLGAACSGHLTADWRDGHPTPSPTIAPPVRRPRQFRALANFDLEEIPEAWQWAQVDDLLPTGGIFDGPFGSNLKSSDYTDSGARVIRLENIGHLDFIDEKRTYVSQAKYQTLQKHSVRPGDIVFSSFIGDDVRVCVLPEGLDEKALAKADCFTLRPTESFDRTYLALQLATPRSRSILASDVHGATRPRINTTQLRSLPIPICSHLEQEEIVRRYTALVRVADEISKKLDRTVVAIDRSTQAVLAKAFRGDLVLAGAEQGRND